MEYKLEFSGQVQGETFKEIRDHVSKRVNEFLAGTKGVYVEINISQAKMEATLSGAVFSNLWDYQVHMAQETKKAGG